jgi:hypothetical protein
MACTRQMHACINEAVQYYSFLTVMEGALARRVANALYGMLIADALAMPVHWFYNPADIVKQVLTQLFASPLPSCMKTSFIDTVWNNQRLPTGPTLSSVLHHEPSQHMYAQPPSPKSSPADQLFALVSLFC